MGAVQRLIDEAEGAGREYLSIAPSIVSSFSYWRYSNTPVTRVSNAAMGLV